MMDTMEVHVHCSLLNNIIYNMHSVKEGSKLYQVLDELCAALEYYISTPVLQVYLFIAV